MNSFESRLFAALEQPAAGNIYLAAVSGGADSTAMLAGLAELRGEARFVLHCVHVEHGIRPAAESRGDAGAVEALCEKLEVPCRVISVPPGRIAAFAASGGPGIEGAARYFRHKAWNREARRIGAGKILTAHTRDDLMETLLMRILRGAGPAGLAPMSRLRGRLLRPLLDMTRGDVLAYLAEKGISYRTDSTNADIRYLRNRVRLKLIPLLDDFFPNWRTSLLALAETQSLTAEFLAAEVRERLPWKKGGADGEEESAAAASPFLRLSEKDFLKAPPILREEAVFAGADMLASALAGKKRRNFFCTVPRRASVRRAVEDSAAPPEDLGPVRLERRNGLITLKPAPRSSGKREFSLLIKKAGSYTLKGKVLGLSGARYLRITVRNGMNAGNPPGAVVFSAAGFRARLPLVLRSHRSSDRLFRAGHKRRFSDILDRNARSGYTGIITAQDAEGPAAFIGIGGNLMVKGRDVNRPPEPDSGAKLRDSFFIEVSLETRFFEKPITGGMDV